MPELPEVETVRKGLLDYLPIHIKKVERTPELKSILKTEDFSLEGKTIKSLERKGKVLIFHFKEGEAIVSRFGMSGAWEISEKKNPKKHNHLQLFFIMEFFYLTPKLVYLKQESSHNDNI